MAVPPTPNKTSALLQVRDLRVHFPVRRGLLGRATGVLKAVDGVSLDIDRGMTLSLVGESGCGKTTLGRAILRLVDAAEGRVTFDGVDVLTASRGTLRTLRRSMQIVFQDPQGSLNPRMTVERIIGEPLAVHGVVYGRALRRRVTELLDNVGLHASDASRYPHEFSGGQRQRIGVARAIALNPKFVVCDEPVSALDVSVQAQILNLLTRLQRELGLAYLFIAHNLAVVAHISDRVAVMYLGKIVEEADADELFSRPRHPYTMALLSSTTDPQSAIHRSRSLRQPLRPPLASGGRGSPSRDERSTAISGEVPSALHPPTGCAFHPRCPFATDLCRHTAPALSAQTDGPETHLVACHYNISPGNAGLEPVTSSS